MKKKLQQQQQNVANLFSIYLMTHLGFEFNLNKFATTSHRSLLI